MWFEPVCSAAVRWGREIGSSGGRSVWAWNSRSAARAGHEQRKISDVPLSRLFHALSWFLAGPYNSTCTKDFKQAPGDADIAHAIDYNSLP